MFDKVQKIKKEVKVIEIVRREVIPRKRGKEKSTD